jgi:hypothetical protein
MLVNSYSATSTIIGAAHVHNTRARLSRGEPVFKSVNTTFNGTTLVNGLSDWNLTGFIAAGDYVEFYDNTASGMTPPELYFRPQFVGKISSFVDNAGVVNDSITLTSDNFFGSPQSLPAGRWTILVYRPSNERPIFSFRNSYGVHRINNLRQGYSRMLHAEGGTPTHPVRTIFDGVMFCGRSVRINPSFVALGPTWMYDPGCATTKVASDAAAKAIAMLYTTNSSGWVTGQIAGAYDEANGLEHSGRQYQNFSWRGQLNGAGAFTGEVDIRVWSTPPPP